MGNSSRGSEGGGKMARWSKTWRCVPRPLAVVAFLGVLSLAGCSKEPANPDDARKAVETEKPQVAVGKTDPTKAEDLPPPPNDEQHQPFAKATRRADDPPPEMQPPPDVTASGKSVGKLYTEVV